MGGGVGGAIVGITRKFADRNCSSVSKCGLSIFFTFVLANTFRTNTPKLAIKVAKKWFTARSHYLTYTSVAGTKAGQIIESVSWSKDQN